ncbi:hypothetical protein Z043_108380 [Scleropages formosus]|uniref:Alpha-carbonic anhydrase domain-containing protein n=1 Tax=Scleropages formosus TaxID=113540 RepID=A0A0P7XC14_SCLFO|nr:hypothetical protein Z043_108380 [Scleropages formosus]
MFGNIACLPTPTPTGPYSWGDAYPSCHPIVGAHHSPINLDGNMARNDSLGGVHLEGFQGVHAGEWRLKNNGHSVVLELGGGMAVMGGGLPGTYQTLQLHFHWGSSTTNGSEHTLDSRRYPMEVRHNPERGEAVLSNTGNIVAFRHGLAPGGVAAQIQASRAVTSRLWALVAVFSCHLGKMSILVEDYGKTVTVKPFPLLNLLPAQNLSQFYRYHGSLTTPPCSQAVMWTVFEVPIYVSQQQINAFTSGIYQSEEGANKTLLQRNFRHIHETFSREVLASRDATLIPVSAVASARSALALVLFALLLLPTWLP